MRLFLQCTQIDVYAQTFILCGRGVATKAIFLDPYDVISFDFIYTPVRVINEILEPLHGQSLNVLELISYYP